MVRQADHILAQVCDQLTTSAEPLFGTAVCHDPPISARKAGRGFGMCLAHWRRMLLVEPKKLMRDILVGFGIGLVVMLGLTYSASGMVGTTTAASTSAQ
jgi:hypothetical protein